MRDIFETALTPGTIFAYAVAKGRSSATLRIGKILADGSCRIIVWKHGLNPDGSWGYRWRAMKGRPNDTVVVIDPLFVSIEAWAELHRA